MDAHTRRKFLTAGLSGLLLIAAVLAGAVTMVMAGFALAIVTVVLLLSMLMQRDGERQRRQALASAEDILQKKYPGADIRRYGHLIFLLSLTLSIGMVLTAFEWQSADLVRLDSLSGQPTNTEELLEIPPVLPATALPPPPAVASDEYVAVPDDTPLDPVLPDLIDLPALEPTGTQPIQFQTDLPTGPVIEETPEEPVYIAEFAAEPEGGMQAFYQYVRRNLEYPRSAQRVGVEGRVTVQFVVEKDGTLSDFKVLKGIGAGCDEEAVRVLKNSPAWKPARQRGRTVRQRMTLPITFSLSK